MPRSFLDLIRGGKLHRDDTGDEFTGFEDAQTQAQAVRPDITKEHLPDGDLHKIRCNVRTGAAGPSIGARSPFRTRVDRGRDAHF